MSSVTKVELQFTTLLGRFKSIDVSSKRFEASIKSGKVIDGSSVHMAQVERSDLLLKPIEGTYFQLPWDPTVARVLCDVFNPSEKARGFGKENEYSPRYVLKKTLERAKDLGFKFMTGTEMEFFVLKNGRLLDSAEYFSPTPLDRGASLRREISDTLPIAKMESEYLHHEVSSGQYEICLKYDDALKMADNVVTFRYLAKNLADQRGLLLTFMPKPFEGMNGSGMHIHMSLSNERGDNLFFGRDTLSDVAKFFIGGILIHAKALAAVATPTVNSYKRLVVGYEAPVYIAWGFMNRSALVRIPSFSSKTAARIELRMPDPSCNPYLVFACILAAGLEGIQKRIEPGEPCGINTFENSEDFEALPRNLEEALIEVSKDPLLADVLGKEAQDKFVTLKRKEWEDYIQLHKSWNPLKITEWEKERYLDIL